MLVLAPMLIPPSKRDRGIRRKVLLTLLEGHRAVLDSCSGFLDNCNGFQFTAVSVPYATQQVLRSERDQRLPTLRSILAGGTSQALLAFPRATLAPGGQQGRQVG